MPMVIRASFNNRNWSGQCKNADRDRRLFQCHDSIVNVKYQVSRTGQCTGECWEQSLCSNHTWNSLPKAAFGENAAGRAYFMYRDVDKSLVLWGHSRVRHVDGNVVTFDRFKPLPRERQVLGLTYHDLEQLGVPKWGSGTYRYITEGAADRLDAVISGGDETLIDPSEEYCALEGKAQLRHHVTKERSAALIKAFKSQLTDFSCAVCGFSFEQTYGALGAKYIEAHHALPVASLTAQTKMSVSDLVAVCSNCHRMLHRADPPLSVKALQKNMERQ